MYNPRKNFAEKTGYSEEYVMETHQANIEYVVYLESQNKQLIETLNRILDQCKNKEYTDEMLRGWCMTYSWGIIKNYGE